MNLNKLTQKLQTLYLYKNQKEWLVLISRDKWVNAFKYLGEKKSLGCWILLFLKFCFISDIRILTLIELMDSTFMFIDVIIYTNFRSCTLWRSSFVHNLVNIKYILCVYYFIFCHGYVIFVSSFLTRIYGFSETGALIDLLRYMYTTGFIIESLKLIFDIWLKQRLHIVFIYFIFIVLIFYSIISNRTGVGIEVPVSYKNLIVPVHINRQ